MLMKQTAYSAMEQDAKNLQWDFGNRNSSSKCGLKFSQEIHSNFYTITINIKVQSWSTPAQTEWNDALVHMLRQARDMCHKSLALEAHNDHSPTHTHNQTDAVVKAMWLQCHAYQNAPTDFRQCSRGTVRTDSELLVAFQPPQLLERCRDIPEP